jgi:hypothetical protein
MNMFTARSFSLTDQLRRFSASSDTTLSIFNKVYCLLQLVYKISRPGLLYGDTL